MILARWAGLLSAANHLLNSQNLLIWAGRFEPAQIPRIQHTSGFEREKGFGKSAVRQDSGSVAALNSAAGAADASRVDNQRRPAMN
jgi:hypothetical protein